MARFFTPEEADSMLPLVREHLSRIAEKRALLDSKERESAKCSRLDEYIEVKRAIDEVMIEYWSAILNLESLGCVLKSLENGLLDFPAIRLGEQVWLCWKEGEGSVSYWHGIHEGYPGRKAVVAGEFSGDSFHLKAEV